MKNNDIFNDTMLLSDDMACDVIIKYDYGYVLKLKFHPNSGVTSTNTISIPNITPDRLRTFSEIFKEAANHLENGG